MNKNVFKRIFDKITRTPQQKRHSMVGSPNLWKMKQSFQFEFLKGQGLQKDQKLLDIGCGTLRGGIPIIDFLEKENYYGIDVRPRVLEEAWKELKYYKLEHKNPSLISFNRFEELKFNTEFDVMFAFSVLIHLEDEIADSCFQFVSHYLKPEGVFYANVNIDRHQDGSWQGFPVVFRSLDFYKQLANKNGLTLLQMGRLKDLGHISGQKKADRQIMLEIRKG